MEKMGLVVIVAVLGLVVGVRGQIPSCATDLIPCQEYINATSPPPSCCGPLKKAIETELPCLCSLFQNEALLKLLKINRTAALELPGHCGINVDMGDCATAPSPTPGATDKNGARKMELMEMSGLAALLLIWVSMLV